MSKELYLCVHAAEFPAQALLRLRRDLQPEPVAVFEGRPPLETICALNRNARLRGAVPGMARLEAEGIAGLHLLPRSTEGETATHCSLEQVAAIAFGIGRRPVLPVPRRNASGNPALPRDIDLGGIPGALHQAYRHRREQSRSARCR